MDLSLCVEILNKRNTLQCDCSNINHLDSCTNNITNASQNTPDVSKIVKINADYLTEMTDYELLKLMISLQRARVTEYSTFEQALKLLINENKLDDYPSLVAEMTSRFSILSQHVLKIKEEFSKRNKNQIVGFIEKTQAFEKEKLTLVASQQLDQIQSHNPGLIRFEGGKYEVLSNSMYTIDRIKNIEEKISDCLLDLQSELCDLQS